MKKKTLASLVNYSTFLSLPGITFQNKEKYSTHYNYSILQLEYFFLSNFLATRVCSHTSWLPGTLAVARSARACDKVQTCYSHQGNNDTRILGEKSFKSMEANYSNLLASPLVASSGETSPSPRIHCDNIKFPYQRCQFLGTKKQATPRM